MKTAVRALAALALAFAAGCGAGRHRIANPGVSQALPAQSGDRFFMDLEEPADCRWLGECADGDVSVIVDRRPGKAQATIRIHRGFDGPATVKFRLVRGGEPPVRKFAVTLFRRTGDYAFWE